MLLRFILLVDGQDQLVHGLEVQVLEAERRHARIRFVNLGVLGARQGVSELLVSWEGAAGAPGQPGGQEFRRLEARSQGKQLPGVKESRGARRQGPTTPCKT